MKIIHDFSDDLIDVHGKSMEDDGFACGEIWEESHPHTPSYVRAYRATASLQHGAQRTDPAEPHPLRADCLKRADGDPGLLDLFAMGTSGKHWTGKVNLLIGVAFFCYLSMVARASSDVGGRGCSPDIARIPRDSAASYSAGVAQITRVEPFIAA